MSIGVTSLLGSDDLLAAFTADKCDIFPTVQLVVIVDFVSWNCYSWDGDFNAQTENAVFSSVIDLVLSCGAFIYIGA